MTSHAPKRHKLQKIAPKFPHRNPSTTLTPEKWSENFPKKMLLCPPNPNNQSRASLLTQPPRKLKNRKRPATPTTLHELLQDPDWYTQVPLQLITLRLPLNQCALKSEPQHETPTTADPASSRCTKRNAKFPSNFTETSGCGYGVSIQQRRALQQHLHSKRKV